MDREQGCVMDGEERKSLEARYGPFPLVQVDLAMEPSSVKFYRKAFKSRRGEILFVLRRPSGDLLLHTKHSYPSGLFRIPGGGIDWGEPVPESLRREVREETQFDVDCERLLGVLQYRFHSRESQPAEADVHFISFVFEVPGVEGEPVPEDQSEGISGFKWIPPAELVRVAVVLRSLPNDERGRGDWGRFRAIGHDFVSQQLG